MLRHARVPVPAASLLLAVMVSACAGTAPSQAPTPTAAASAAAATVAPSPSPEPSPFTVPASFPAGTVGAYIGGETNGVTVCGGSIWVAYYLEADLIAQVDPLTATVLGQVEGGVNSVCFDGEPWVAVTTAIEHLDPKTRAVLASVEVPTAYYVGAGAGSIWTASGLDVIRIDPATATIVATIPAATAHDITEVEGDADAIWATEKQRDVVHRIDPATNKVVADIPAGPYAHGILVQPDAVWISNAHSKRVTRIDPATNTGIDIKGPGEGVGLAEGAGFVWASTLEGDLYRIDPATNVATNVLHVGGWPYGIGFFDDVLWVTDGLGAVFGIPIGALLPGA